jgi:hypothetical protein
MALVRVNKFNQKQLLIFLFWPFLSLISSIRNRESPWAKNIFWLFCAFYGYTFIINSEGVDAYRYSQWFISLRHLDFTLSNFISTLYTKETNYIDILQPLISFIISRFTSNPHWLFAAFGFVFGYFYSRNIWFLFENIKTKYSLTTILFLLTYILLIPIWQINGFRFWTAAHVYLFGLLPYLLKNEKKYIGIAALSVFVHFSLIAPVAILIIYAFVGNRRTFFFLLFIITLFISELNISLIKQQLAYLPEFFQRKSDIYLYEGAMNVQQHGISLTNWYVRYYGTILKWISYSYLIIVYFRGKSIYRNDSRINNIYCFTLFLFAFINLADLIPQGIRFNAICNMLVLFLICYIPYSGALPVEERIFRAISAPLLLIIIIVSVRRGFDYTGISSILGNPLIAPFINNDIPLINLIK